MPSKAAAQTKPEDKATADTKRGLVETNVAMTEDQKRAAELDAGSEAEPHSYEPEDNAGSGSGSVIDTYAGMPTGTHPNAAGDAGTNGPLALGQAPVAAARPVRGSANHGGEKFDPEMPNAIMQSPVVRGVEMDPRNAPDHPEFAEADKKHPDYGKPVEQHKGVRVEAPTMYETKPSIVSGDKPNEIENSKAQPGAAVA